MVFILVESVCTGCVGVVCLLLLFGKVPGSQVWPRNLSGRRM